VKEEKEEEKKEKEEWKRSALKFIGSHGEPDLLSLQLTCGFRREPLSPSSYLLGFGVL